MKKHLGEIYILFSAMLWGCISLTVRPLQSYGFSAMQIVAIRGFLTLIFLTIIILIKDRSLFKINIKDFPVFLGSGLISFLFFNFCYMNSMQENSVSVACMLMYTSPIWITLLSRIIFKENLNIFKILALIGTLCGCVMVVFGNNGETKITWIGLLFGLGSGIGYALYSIFGKIASRKYNSLTTSFYTFVVATIFGLPISRFWETPQIIANNYISIVYFVAIAFFCTVLPYIFYTKGLATVDAGIAGIISIIEVVVATIVGYFAYNENIGIVGILGIVVVIISLVFLELKGNKKQKPIKKT